MVIALNRFVIITGRETLRSLYAYVVRPMTIKRLLLLIAVIGTLTSGQVTLMYIVDERSGVRFEYGLVNGTTAMVWQEEGKDSLIEDGIKVIPVFWIGLQLIVTLVLYVSIIYTMIRSTNEVNRVSNSTTENARPATTVRDESNNTGGPSAAIHPPEPKINNWINQVTERLTNRQLQVRSGHLQVPMSNIVLAKADINCTISLTLQIAAMLATFVLNGLMVRISGKVITPDEYIFGMVSGECAIVFTTLIDPITFLLVSKDFRNAAKTCLFH